MQLLGGWEVLCYDVAAVERVQVGFVLAGEDDGVDVFDHEALVANVGVGGTAARQGEKDVGGLWHCGETGENKDWDGVGE